MVDFGGFGGDGGDGGDGDGGDGGGGDWSSGYGGGCLRHSNKLFW